MSISWNTGLAAERARARAQRDAAQFNLKLKLKKIKKRVRSQASKRGRVGPKIFKLDKSSSIG